MAVLKDVKNLFKIYFINNKRSSNIKIFVVYIMLIFITYLLGIFDGKLEIKYYDSYILCLEVTFIVFLFAILSNDIGLSRIRKIMHTSNLYKKLYTIAPIVFNNVLGLIFILIFSIIRYIAVIRRLGNMGGFYNTLFVLIILLGITNFVKVAIVFSKTWTMISTVLIIVISIFTSKYHFIFLDVVKMIFNNNSMYVPMTGVVLWLILNASAYFYSRYIS